MWCASSSKPKRTTNYEKVLLPSLSLGNSTFLCVSAKYVWQFNEELVTLLYARIRMPMKLFLHYILFLLFILPAPLLAKPLEFSLAPLEAVPTEEISISIKGRELRVQHAEGQSIDIYNVAGVKVMTQRVDSEDKVVLLNIPRGIYIVKVGKVARRINVL